MLLILDEKHTQMMNKLLENLQSTLDISEADLATYEEKFKLVQFPKKSLILTQGQIENYLYFINEGYVRLFLKNTSEKEVTFAFAFNGWFYSAYDSFLQQSPCRYNVQAMEDTEVYRISFDDLQELYRSTSIGQIHGRKAAEQLYMMKVNREIALLTQKPEERYKALLESLPFYLQRIPQKYLASYIGITPQALSRIRKRIF